MRWYHVGLVSLLLVLPAASSQSAEANEVVIEDPAGDVAAGSQETDQFPHLDILKFSFAESTEDTFTARVEFEQLENPYSGLLSRFLRLEFAFRDISYELDWPTGTSCGGQAGGALFVVEPAGRRLRGCAEATIDAASSAVSFAISRAWVQDSMGIEARLGDEINITSVRASATIAGEGAEDSAPNDGVPRTLVTQLGARGAGDIRLQPIDPVRATNGGAITFVYETRLYNEADEAKELGVELRGVPADWDAYVPPLFVAEGKSNTTIPVVVSIPFAHQHGQRAEFILRVDELGDAATWAETVLGVEWLDIPQPGGHHELLYLHSRPIESRQTYGAMIVGAAQDQSMWINTVADDPDPTADDAPMPGYAREVLMPGNPSAYDVNWWMPLAPELRIGLDPDPTRTAQLEWVISGAVPAEEARVTARVIACDVSVRPTRPEEVHDCGGSVLQVLAEGAEAVTDWQRQKHAGSLEMPYEDVQTVPYVKGTQLYLHITLAASIPQNFALVEPRPMLHVDEMQLHLPLLEYQDPVPEALSAMGELQLRDALASTRANPGTLARLEWTIRNNGTQEHTVEARVVSSVADWLKIPKSWRIPAGEERTLEVLVDVPTDAALQRHDGAILLSSELANLVARFTIDVVDPDEEALPGIEGTAERKSPIPLHAIGVGLLALAALRRGLSRQ